MTKANVKGLECTLCKKWVGFIESLIDTGVDDIAEIFKLVRAFPINISVVNNSTLRFKLIKIIPYTYKYGVRKHSLYKSYFMYFKYCEAIEVVTPNIGKYCLALVEDIDEIIHWIVDEEFSPTHICCLGYHVCTDAECQEASTTPPPTPLSEKIPILN